MAIPCIIKLRNAWISVPSAVYSTATLVLGNGGGVAVIMQLFAASRHHEHDTSGSAIAPLFKKIRSPLAGGHPFAHEAHEVDFEVDFEVDHL